MKKAYNSFLHVLILVQFILIHQLYFHHERMVKIMKKTIHIFSEFRMEVYSSTISNYTIIKDYLISNDLLLNNRQFAILIWILLVSGVLLKERKVRESFFSVAKIFFSKKLLILWLSALAYNVVIICFLSYQGLWNISYLKVTILWLLFVGYLMLFNVIGDANDNSYFINLIKQNLKLTILFQFILNLYTFSLLAELIIVPVTFAISMMVVIAEQEKEKSYQKVATFLNHILFFIGVRMMWNSLSQIIAQFSELNFDRLFVLLSIGSILSILFIPFLVVVTVSAAYEYLFIPISFKKVISEDIKKYLYFRIVLACKFDVKKIKNFISESDVLLCSMNNKKDVNKFIKAYELKQKENNNLHLT